MANEHPDFRIVYYDDLNGYYKMSPIGFMSEELAIAQCKRTQNSRTPAWGIVKVIWSRD